MAGVILLLLLAVFAGNALYYAGSTTGTSDTRTVDNASVNLSQQRVDVGTVSVTNASDGSTYPEDSYNVTYGAGTVSFNQSKSDAPDDGDEVDISYDHYEPHPVAESLFRPILEGLGGLSLGLAIVVTAGIFFTVIARRWS